MPPKDFQPGQFPSPIVIGLAFAFLFQVAQGPGLPRLLFLSRCSGGLTQKSLDDLAEFLRKNDLYLKLARMYGAPVLYSIWISSHVCQLLFSFGG